MSNCPLSLPETCGLKNCGETRFSDQSGQGSSRLSDQLQATLLEGSADVDEVPDPLLGWTRRQKAEFLAIWKALTGETHEDMMAAGIEFVIWLYHNITGLRETFPRFGDLTDDEMRCNPEFLRHVEITMTVAENLVKSLRKGDAAARECFETVAQKHHRMIIPVTVGYFEDLRDKIHIRIYEVTGLGKDSNASVLWYQFVDAIVRVYKEELVKMDQEDRERQMALQREKSIRKISKKCCTIM